MADERSTYRHRDADRRRAYMRDYMRRRRARLKAQGKSDEQIEQS